MHTRTRTGNSHDVSGVADCFSYGIAPNIVFANLVDVSLCKLGSSIVNGNRKVG